MIAAASVAFPALLALLPLSPRANAAEPEPSAAAAVDDWLVQTEEQLLEHMTRRERAWWVQANFITHDTEIIAAQEVAAMMAFVSEAAADSMRFEGADLTADQARKLALLRQSLALPAPGDPELREELSSIASSLSSTYGRGRYCSERWDGDCLTLSDLSDILRESDDWDELVEVWEGWRTVSEPMGEPYARFVELANQGAHELGYDDLGVLWRSRYDMDPEAFEDEVDRLWEQVAPLYRELHTYVRSHLQDRFGEERVPDGEPIPAHLLGNMWAQDWQTFNAALVPEKDRAIDLDAAIQGTDWSAVEMARQAESFFVSLGLPSLPETFYERSLFTRPPDRDVVCHASAWDIDFDEDVRIKMCIRPRYADFSTLHHELGHIYYYYTAREHSPLFRGDANAAFNEAVGDTILLSVTPSYLAHIGVIDSVPEGGELNALMARALDAVVLLPFAMVVDKWRWHVFSGEVAPERYNAHWWELREQYQGITPPVERTGEHFDPGAKYHVAANTPYIRYFLARILQYQFHRALCRQAGHDGPLHTCSIFGDEEAGRRLEAMMALGSSRPWPEALEVLTGETEMDASAILEYYEPLYRWLKKQNRRTKKGW